MLIFFWVLLLIIFCGTLTLLFILLPKSSRMQEFYNFFANGFNGVLRGHGLKSSLKYPIELWVWETMDDEEVCEDCLERASWPPMDIVEWMKEGLPRTPECDTLCGKRCRCQLVPYNPQKPRKSHHRH